MTERKSRGKIVGGMNYRQWQQRNSAVFKELSRKQQKILKAQGYRNLGWDYVQKSWELLCPPDKVIRLLDYKLSRGDIAGAVDISLLGIEDAKKLAKEIFDRVDAGHSKVKSIAGNILKKYQLV